MASKKRRNNSGSTVVGGVVPLPGELSERVKEVQPPIRVETPVQIQAQTESPEHRAANSVSYNTQSDQYDRLAAEAAKSYDQTLLTLSSGALGISMAFLKDLILPGSEIWVLCCLYGAWILWGTTVTMMLFNMHFSYKAMVVSRAIIDEEYLRYTRGELNTTDFWETARSRQKDVPYNKWINWINNLSVYTFAAGILCLGIFVGASKLKGIGVPSQKPSGTPSLTTQYIDPNPGNTVAPPPPIVPTKVQPAQPPPTQP